MVATKNITPTKQTALYAVVALLLAAGGAQSLCQFNREWQRDQLRADVLQTHAQSAMPASAIDDAADDSASQNYAAATAIYNAERTESFADRLRTMNKARVLQESALAKAPADPYGWMRLAHLRLVTQYNRDGALAALRQSVASGPYEPPLLLARTKQLFELRDLITPEDTILQTAWRDSWHADWMKTIAAVRADHRYIGSIDIALQGEAPEVYAEWQRQFGKQYIRY